MAKKQQTNSRRRRAPTPASWKPGQSGNDKGRPRKGLSLKDNLRDVLLQVDEGGHTRAELLAEKYVELAEAGSVTAMENINARFDGRPEQGIKVSGDEERPLHVRHSERGKS